MDSELTQAEFVALVEDAVAGLPVEILQHLSNVAVTVSDWPTGHELQRAGVDHPWQLFGLYEGVPLTRRGTHYNLIAPDRIVIYWGPLQRSFATASAIRKQVRRTVVHEIAHHFGISETRIRELGF